MPLLEGLHVLYSRKVGFLLRDSAQTNKVMSDPIDVIKVEAGEQNAVPGVNTGTKRNKAPNSNPRVQDKEAAL